MHGRIKKYRPIKAIDVAKSIIKITENNYNKVHLAYGRNGFDLSIPENFDVIEPKFIEEIGNAKKAINDALIKPINSKPLRKLLENKKNIAISVCDITRAQPRKIVIETCLLYTSPSPRDRTRSRMPSSA